MERHLKQLIDVNTSGRVFAVCSSRGIKDPIVIGCYTDIMRQAIEAEISDECTPETFKKLLDKKSKWLEAEIDQVRQDEAPVEQTPAEQNQADGEQDEPNTKSSGYVPKAKSMPERLADERAEIEKMLTTDCVNLKLLTPKQAAAMKRRMFGKETKKAEEEIVVELRNTLHQQIRAFIRKHEGGPWSSASLQDELRMDIAATKSVRSVTNMAKELLLEREEWLKENRGSLSGLLFGGKINITR
jgi:hypothetical protein